MAILSFDDGARRSLGSLERNLANMLQERATQMAEEVAKEAMTKMSHNLKKELAKTVLNVLSEYKVQTMQENLVITVRNPDA